MRKAAGYALPSGSFPVWISKTGRVVKGVNFLGLRDAGDPVETAAAYASGADEVVFWISTPPMRGGPPWWKWPPAWRRSCPSPLR